MKDRQHARPRVIRGTQAKPLPLLPSGPGGVCSRPLHGARSLTIHYFTAPPAPATMKVRPMIKALVFDLGKTLVPFDFKHGYALLEKRCPYPAAEIPKRIGATDLVIRFESGQVGSREFVEQLCGVLDLEMSYQEFRAIWFSIFLPGTLVDESWLAALGERYPLVLLSNTNPMHFEMLEANYPILRLFEHRVLSYQVSAMK